MIGSTGRRHGIRPLIVTNDRATYLFMRPMHRNNVLCIRLLSCSPNPPGSYNVLERVPAVPILDYSCIHIHKEPIRIREIDKDCANETETLLGGRQLPYLGAQK